MGRARAAKTTGDPGSNPEVARELGVSESQAQRDELRLDERLFGGTFAPFFRASERPMAIACLRLLALGCLPDPAFSFPRLARCMALRTLFCAPLPYLRPFDFRPLDFRVAIVDS